MASASWQRRNERARSLGYESYYDYRAHGYGLEPPSAPRPTGRVLAVRRGHRSRADLLAKVGEGAVVSATGFDRDPRSGVFRRLRVTVIDEEGRDTEFVLRGRAAADLDRLADQVEGLGGVLSPAPSLNLRRLSEEEEDDVEEADAA